MNYEIVGGLSEQAYADIEHQAYEAAIVPELWPRVLEQLGVISGTAGAAILCINERGQHLVHIPVLEKAANRFLDEGWGERNSRAAGVIAKGLVGVPRFVTEVDYFDPNQMETDPMVNELFRAEGFGWAAGFLAQLPHGDLVIMNVEQYYERGPIQGAALERLNSLYPHLARAAMFAGRADFERTRTAIDTLTAVGLPAAALTPSGKVILANAAFNAATHVWTTRGGDKLGLIDKVADRQLRDALTSIDHAKSPRSVPIRNIAGGAVTAVLQIIPIRRSAHDVFGSTCAIAVLSESSQPGSDHTLIQSLFDLTPAELSVAKALAETQTIAEIAKSHGRSIETVRYQLKSIMSKTGCSRQIELVLLMRQLGQRGG